MSQGQSPNIMRRNALEPRSVLFLFRPNGTGTVTDIYDPLDAVASITRTGVGTFAVVMQPGVAQQSATGNNSTWTNGAALAVRPDMRTSLASMGFKCHAAQVGGPTYDSAGRLTFTLVVVDSANAAADTSNVANVVQCTVEWDDARQ